MPKMSFPKLKNKLVLAPMAGITDIAFRLLCREQGASLCFTEFASSEGIIRRDDLPRIKELKSTGHADSANKDNLFNGRALKDRPLAVQIFGNNPESLFTSTEKIISMKICDVIDINFGCPSTKIAGCGAGGELLKHPDKIKKILRKLCQLDFPISCKFRLGIDKDHIVALEIAETAEEAGCCAVTLHPRTVEQGYSGKADWNFIEKIKEKISIPVIGNGDINEPKDAVAMLEKTGCDYVMIGRSAMRDPTIFSRTLYFMKTENEKESSALIPALKEKIVLLNEYFGLMQAFGINSPAKMKAAACNFTKGYAGSSKIREKICAAKTEGEIIKIISDFI